MTAFCVGVLLQRNRVDTVVRRPSLEDRQNGASSWLLPEVP